MARTAEANQRRQAERRLGQIEKLNDILGAIFSDIDPFRIELEGKTLAAVLGDRIKQATAALEGDSIDDLLMVARMQVTLGRSHQALDQKIEASEMYNKAQTAMASSIGPDEPQGDCAMMGNLGR